MKGTTIQQLHQAYISNFQVRSNYVFCCIKKERGGGRSMATAARLEAELYGSLSKAQRRVMAMYWRDQEMARLRAKARGHV